MAHQEAVDTELAYTVGSDNVFEDLGFDHPEEELAKAKLVMAIGPATPERELTQVEVAALLGIDQPKVSALLKGRYGGFSTGRLLRLLVALDRDVDIVVRSARATAHVTVLVAI
jgi:predicted XRE-type DNA-binding protein